MDTRAFAHIFTSRRAMADFQQLTDYDANRTALRFQDFQRAKVSLKVMHRFKGSQREIWEPGATLLINK